MLIRSLLLVGGIAVSVALFGPMAGEAVLGLTSDAGSGEMPSPTTPALSANTPVPHAITIDGNGHFRASAMVNGGTATMLVDTGASVVVLTQNDAQAAGFNPAPSAFTGRAQTAAGAMAVAPVIIERLSVAGIERRNVRGVVAQGNALPSSLLGQSFLSTLHEVRIADGQMMLKD